MKILQLVDTSELWLIFKAKDADGDLIVEVGRKRAEELSRDLLHDQSALERVRVITSVAELALQMEDVSREIGFRHYAILHHV